MALESLPSGGTLDFTVTARLTRDVLVSVSQRFRAVLLGDPDLENNWVTPAAITRVATYSTDPSLLLLRSDSGDYIGRGRDYSHTQANAAFEVIPRDGALELKVKGDQEWTGWFYMPEGFAQLQPGTYIDRLGAPFHDPATGGLVWRGEGRACASHNGWFIVDDIVYAAGEIASLDLRFHQHCGIGGAPLRGQIHWRADDTTQPPGPVNPIPADLWEPEPGSTPSSGNYIYTNSDPGDFIGNGLTSVFTEDAQPFSMIGAEGTLSIGADGTGLSGTFKAMLPLTQLQMGYYPDVQRWLFGNPARGQMDVGLDSRGCNALDGWFVIDHIEYSGEDLTAVDLRFEQHCEFDLAALRGKVHWHK
jgi:hypothetical protein